MRTSKYFNNNIILVCAICVVMSFVSQLFNISVISNMVYAFTLVFVFAYYFMSGYVSKTMLFLIIDIIIASTIRGFVTDDIVNYYSHILIMLCTFMCIEVGANAKIDIKLFKIISTMFILMTVVLLVAYYFGPLKTNYFEKTQAVHLNFPNPNAAGLWLVCIFVLLFYCAFLYKKALRFAFFVCAIGIVPIIFATESRSSYFACFFLVICALIVKIFNIKKIPNWCLAVLACLPIIVFFFYMFVIVKNQEFWQGVFAFESVDKSIDSRQNIWQKVLDNFWNCFLVGDYKYYYDSQQHNSLITIFCRFGAPAVTAVCMLTYRALKELQERSSLYAALSLGAVLFTGCFEASVFVGIAGLYLMLLIIPSCASVEKI